MKIAMWSGPRNLSTALMYSFAQRSDCSVVDEPYYAAYLAETGLVHPMRDEILASQPQDPAKVAGQLAAPTRTPIQYQKHMTHHMLGGWGLDWLADVKSVFLIRHPARVIASYAAKRENLVADDLGFRQQIEIYERVRALGHRPIVIDSTAIRANPKQALTSLCAALGISFDANMLCWPVGGNKADGVWASHWYGSVRASTGFAGAEPKLPELAPKFSSILAESLQHYLKLWSFRLRFD